MEIEKEMEEFVEKESTKTRDIIEREAKQATLAKLYETMGKYLYIKDYNRIDVILAVVLSNQLPGTPLWMFITGNSGDTKTTAVKGLIGWKNVKPLGKITPKTLASGMKGVKDLGSELNQTSTILLFFDMASMSGIDKNAKAEIWGQFRDLYDGFVLNRTGSGVKKEYDNCHVTFIGCSTDTLRNEILLNAHLGTRELIYDTNADMVDNEMKMDAAWDNENYEEEMFKDIQQITHQFLNSKIVDPNMKIPDDMRIFIKREAERLIHLRASQATDYKHGQLINRVRPEVPTRLTKQFKRLYKSLKALDENYPDEKCKDIITHIVNSSGNELRQKIISFFEKREEEDSFTVEDIRSELRVGRSAITNQLEHLWNMEILNMKTEIQNIGGWVTYDSMGNESTRGGKVSSIDLYSRGPKWVLVHSYQKKKKKKNSLYIYTPIMDQKPIDKY